MEQKKVQDNSQMEEGARESMLDFFGFTGTTVSVPPLPLEVSSTGGMPQELVNGFAETTGHDLSHVQVHKNSSQPTEVNAKAMAKGQEIFLGPGQEEHLPHEAGHIVQQREGRVKTNEENEGIAINDDPELEVEADRWGQAANELNASPKLETQQANASDQGAAQLPDLFQNSSKEVTLEKLDQSLNLLGQELERFLNPEVIAQLHQQIQGVEDARTEYVNTPGLSIDQIIESNYGNTGPVGEESALQTERRETLEGTIGEVYQANPVLGQEGLPADQRLNVAELEGRDQEPLRTIVHDFLIERQNSILEAKDLINEKPELIFRIDQLMPHFYERLGIASGSFQDQMIQKKISSDAIQKLVTGLLLAAIGVALTLLTGGIAGIIIGAGFAGYDLHQSTQDYLEQDTLANVGYANDPHVGWIALSLIGLGLEVAPIARVLNQIQGPAEVFHRTGDPTVLTQALRQAESSGDIDSNVADEIVSQVTNRSEGMLLARQLGYPDPPTGYHWHMMNGEPKVRNNPGNNGPRMEYDPEAHEFTVTNRHSDGEVEPDTDGPILDPRNREWGALEAEGNLLGLGINAADLVQLSDQSIFQLYEAFLRNGLHRGTSIDISAIGQGVREGRRLFKEVTQNINDEALKRRLNIKLFPKREPQYGPLEDCIAGSNGMAQRATGVKAEITYASLNTGTSANGARIAGFEPNLVSDNQRSYNRAHLLAQLLGGRGIQRNLVTVAALANQNTMRAFENAVRRSVENHNAVFVAIVPGYRDNTGIPVGISYRAVDQDGNELFGDNLTILNNTNLLGAPRNGVAQNPAGATILQFPSREAP